jgi:uncharacterized membrane protein YhaH (DUF805 family)
MPRGLPVVAVVVIMSPGARHPIAALGVSTMHWMFLPLKRYADFTGRSRRMEYWMFSLGLAIAVLLFVFVVFALVDVTETRDSPAAIILFAGLGILAWLAIIVPSFAVSVRRFHDQDLSGWFVLLGFIPYIGGLVMIVFMCLPGTKGDNRYGPDPLDPDGVERLSRVFD